GARLSYFIQWRAAALERPHVALCDDAAHVLFLRSLQPDAAATLEQEFVGAGIGHQAAPRGDHRLRMFGEHPLELPALEAAEGILPVHGEHFAELRTGFFLDLAVQLDEGNLESFGELRAECRFARAAQAEQGDRLLLAVVLAHQALDADA